MSGRGRTGVYAETYEIVGTGPFEGTPKISWLNFYDFELVEDRGSTMIIRISERMALERKLVNPNVRKG